MKSENSEQFRPRKMEAFAVQLPSLAMPADLSSSAWTGLRCQTPFSFTKTPFQNLQNLRSCPFTQEKKAKQLPKDRLLYEMRKRAELGAAATEMEKPWFHKPGGVDLWTEKDGPWSSQTADGQPSARLFPKDAVHSTMPYIRVQSMDSEHSIQATDSQSSTAVDDSNSIGIIYKVQSMDSGDARSSRLETPEEQAWEYSEVSVLNSAKDSRQRYGSSRPNEKFHASLESRNGSSVRKARDYNGKRDFNASFSPEKPMSSSNEKYGVDSKSRQGNYYQATGGFKGSRQSNPCVASNSGNNSRQRRGSSSNEVDSTSLNSGHGIYSQNARNYTGNNQINPPRRF
eukprot:Gb_24874 [translate_table: standard]